MPGMLAPMIMAVDGIVRSGQRDRRQGVGLRGRKLPGDGLPNRAVVVIITGP